MYRHKEQQNVQTEGTTQRQEEGTTDGHADGIKDGQTEGTIGGQTEERTDGQTEERRWKDRDNSRQTHSWTTIMSSITNTNTKTTFLNK